MVRNIPTLSSHSVQLKCYSTRIDQSGSKSDSIVRTDNLLEIPWRNASGRRVEGCLLVTHCGGVCKVAPESSSVLPVWESGLYGGPRVHIVLLYILHGN